tara:strand:- start:1218 stop:1502 length:285 start_codon:yes stop_codon:yes gene_type:complete
MSLITSLPKEIIMSDKKSYNYLALRGAPVDDMEYVDTFGLSPESAYSNKINEDMLQYNYDKAVETGMEPDKAEEIKRNAERDIKELLAKNGMLK